MRCPHCDKALDIPRHAIYNVEAYKKPVMVVTNCCGKAVHVKPVFTYEVNVYTGDLTEDDWGSPIKKQQVTS